MNRYIAKTNVSINIVLSSGSNRHIAFSALTGGGSVFYTDDPEIIQAMERHYKFGTLFCVDPKHIAEKPQNKSIHTPKSEKKSEQSESINDEDADDDPEPANELKTIVVSDPDSAKAYLAEQFGYSRTKIKTLKAIKEAAATHGVVFEGI